MISLSNFFKYFHRIWKDIVQKFCGSESNQAGEVKKPLGNSPVPDSDHIIRYVRPTSINEGTINGDAFIRRNPGDDPSVNWMEYFPGNLDSQIIEVRKRRRITYAATGRLARLNVGNMRSHVLNNTLNEHNLRVIQNPLAPTEKYLEDPSHALIKNLPTDDLQGEFVGDLIAQCVIDSYLANLKQE